MTRKIIIDTDPGQDDAVAMLLALASPQDFEILGIVAVAGNIGLEWTVKNTCKILELAGRDDVRCYAGCERPMRRALVTAEHVHGKTGLGGAALPEPQLRLGPQHGVDFIVNRLLGEAPGAITLCAFGPLTDIAMALVKAPAIAPRIREIVLMGGAYSEGGNITPSAEFNIYVDPEAADIVFASGVPITMLPLDVTHQVLTTEERLDRFAAIGNRTGKTVADMLGFSQRFDLEKYGWQGAPLHDPCVIAYLIKPELFKGKEINVAIETASPLTRGMTIADWWRVTDRPPNAFFIREADAAGFYDLLTERLSRLP
jgi:purine nucleosidase